MHYPDTATPSLPRSPGGAAGVPRTVPHAPPRRKVVGADGGRGGAGRPDFLAEIREGEFYIAS